MDLWHIEGQYGLKAFTSSGQAINLQGRRGVITVEFIVTCILSAMENALLVLTCYVEMQGVLAKEGPVCVILFVFV